MGLPYDQQADMWSLGCILCELITTKPMFPACNELELMELIRIRIGLPPVHMIIKCEKRNMLFDSQNKLFRYRRSRIPAGLDTGSIPIRKPLNCDDHDLLSFIDVSHFFVLTFLG